DIVVYDRPIEVLEFPVEISMTTCGEKAASANCRFVYPMKLQTIAAIWSKHHDPQMLGTEVRSFASQETILDSFQMLDFSSDFFGKLSVHDLSMGFKCDDYSWLGRGLNETRTINIREWTQEF